jgi:hypothetical protein
MPPRPLTTAGCTVRFRRLRTSRRMSPGQLGAKERTRLRGSALRAKAEPVAPME